MDNKKVLVFLEFNGKLANDTFDDKDAFIRIANLHKKNPLVQINDTIFKGSHDYTIGTNLFLEEVQENFVQNDPFIKRGRTPFENAFNAVQIIDLKPVKVPPRKKKILNEGTKKIEFNLDWDYKTLLTKFSDGSLRIYDILQNEELTPTTTTTEEEENPDKNETTVEEEEEQEEQMEVVDNNVGSDEVEENVSEEILDNITENTNILEDYAAANLVKDYQKLRQLAFRPVKTSAKKELLQECDPKYKDAYEYHNLECQILQPCDFWPTEPVTDINEQTLCNCVDIDRCILYGLIDKLDNERILTVEEKCKLFTLENLDNLSLAGRYYVLKNQVEALEEYLKKGLKEKFVVDKYGRMPEQTLQIYKKLTEALRIRIQEIKYCLKNDQEMDIVQVEAER